MSDTATPPRLAHRASGPRRRLVIVGAVAAGTSVGAKARRNDEQLEIVVYDRDHDISYSGCGIPYYVGGLVDDADELHPRDPAWFAKRYAMDIRTGHEVPAVDHPNRTIRVTDLATGVEFTDTYDTLVLATGARSIVPPIPGVDAPGVFTVRNIQDAETIRSWVRNRHPKTAVVIGSGFIGLEMIEQLTESGLQVAVVERLPQVMPALDPDMAFRVQEELARHGVTLRVGHSATAIEAIEDAVTGVRLDNDESLPADLVILSVGVRRTPASPSRSEPSWGPPAPSRSTGRCAPPLRTSTRSGTSPRASQRSPVRRCGAPSGRPRTRWAASQATPSPAAP